MLNGGQIIGGEFSFTGKGMFCGINPENGQILDPPFYNAEAAEVDEAVKGATRTFKSYSQLPLSRRADFLDTIAFELENNKVQIIQRCRLETGLPEKRLESEMSRTCNQLRLFAQVVRDGSFLEIRIDNTNIDLRRINIPLGPVAVFGASNFPLAFSVAGGDTVSALAAGCPVVFKANPGHPGTSEMVARAILNAADKMDIDSGIISLIHDKGHDSGIQLAKHRGIKALGFTGSFTGGKALFDIASNRPEPIPVYAEMGSTNPLFILPSALSRIEELSRGIFESITSGEGQFCTNPGLIVLEESERSRDFIDNLIDKFSNYMPGPMLMNSIRQAYEKKIDKLSRIPGVEVISCSPKNSGIECSSSAILILTDTKCFSDNPILEEEVFGPSSIIIRSNNPEETLKLAENLKGQLTNSIFGNREEILQRPQLLDTLKERAGRLIYNGFPTGVTVTHAMHHGGPFPATTASATTSVGTSAVSRFMRPVCYQNYPEELLPEELQNRNSKSIMRLINGKHLKIDI